MSRRIVITFSGAAYRETDHLLVKNAKRFGADDVWVYDDAWLMKQEFYALNRWLWDHRGIGNEKGGRGFGWFSWKPYIMTLAMDRLQNGDIVMFLDADTYPIADFSCLFDECARHGEAMVFSASGIEDPLPNWEWNKRDCMIVMGQDEDRYYNADAGVARFILLRKGSWKVRQFLMEWQTYCLNPLAQTFDASVIGPERAGFKEHRTEQAIFTNLVHKYGWPMHREACEFGNQVTKYKDRDRYGQLFTQVHSKLPKTLEGSEYRNVA